jgi:O-antigen/teichoic acid export membrane protein
MINQLQRWLNKSEFIKNSMTLITGTVIAQLVPILLQPLLRRIYEPLDFGLFAVYSTLLGIIVAFATLRYDSTVMLPKKDEDAANLVAGSIFLAFVSACTIGVILFLFGDQIAILFDLPPRISHWLMLLPLSIFLFSGYQSMNYWLIRKKAFKISSLNKIVRRGAEGTGQLTLGMLAPKFGLIAGNIIGDLFNFVSGIWQLQRNGFQFNFIKKIKIVALFKRYKEFPLYSTLPALLNTLSLSLPVLIINHMYGSEVTGFFDLSRMCLALPLALISVSISQVLFQNLSEKIREKKSIKPLISKTAQMLGIVSLVMIVFGYFLSVPVFKFVFGERWELSGVMTKILIVSYGLKFIVSPLSITFNALEKISVSSMWQVFYFLAIGTLFFLDRLDLETFLFVYMGIDLVSYGIYFLLLLWQLKKYENSRVQ